MENLMNEMIKKYKISCKVSDALLDAIDEDVLKLSHANLGKLVSLCEALEENLKEAEHHILSDRYKKVSASLASIEKELEEICAATKSFVNDGGALK
jgi:hypothetical protein